MNRPTIASDVLFLFGVLMLACGLNVVAGGLRGINGLLDAAAAHAPRALSGGDSSTVGMFVKAELAPTGTKMTAIPPVPIVAPAPRQPEVTLTEGDLAERDRDAALRATARWTARWYRFQAEADGDARSYLTGVGTARWSARWHRAVLAWDVTRD
jgi:hypothetical protein